MTSFRETEHVDYLGDGLDGIPPAPGRIMAFASLTPGNEAAHVMWDDGPRRGQIDIVPLRDLQKSASLSTMAAGPQVSAPILVRQVMKREGSAGVLQYLAAIHELGTWQDIAEEAVRFVESRLRVDASMNLPYETLTHEQLEQLITTSARTLLRDSFGEPV